MRIGRSVVALRIILGLWSVVCEANSPGATGGSINPVVHGSYEGYHPQQLQQLQHQQQEAWQPQDNYYRQQHQQQEEEEEILAPLPTGWTEHIDPSSGQSYFYNSADGTTTWDRPKAQDGAEVEPKYEQQQQGNAVETSGPENDQGALTEKSETSELPVEAEDQSTLHINKSSEVTESPVSIVGAEVTDRDALTSFVRGEERSREEESWREAQCWNQPNTVNGPSSEQQKPHQEQPQGWGEQQQPRHEKPQGWSLPTEEAPRIHPGWNVNPEQINPADPGSRGSEDQKPDRFPQPVDPRLMQPQQPELQDPRQQIPPAVQKSFEQKQGEFWPTDDSPNQYHFPQVGGSPFPRITTPQVPPMAQKLAEHQQEKSWPTEERLNQHQPPPEGGTPFDRIASQPPWPDPTQPMYPTQERGPIPGRGPYPHDEQKRSQLQQQGPSIQQLPPSRWGQQLQPRGQESQQQPQLAYPQSSQQDLPPQFRPQWPENTVRQQRAPPHEGGYPHGPRPPQPIPHEGQYNRYEPQLNSPPTGQLVSQEEQSVVRESLGKTWKSILGLGTRTKEAVEAATSTVAQSAKGATETITATSSGWWGQAKSAIGSVFETNDGLSQYPLTGIYPPHGPAGSRGNSGYPQQPSQVYPHQPRYPQQQQPGQQLPPQGRYPPGYNPPQPRSDVPYPLESRPGGEPPLQSQWGPSGLQRRYPPQPYDPNRPDGGQPPLRSQRGPPGTEPRYPPKAYDPKRPEGGQPPSQWGPPGPEPRYPPQPYDPNRPGQYLPQRVRPGRQGPPPQRQPPSPESNDKSDPWAHPGLGSEY